MQVNPRSPLLCGPTGGAWYTSAHRGTPAGRPPSLRRNSFVLIDTYKAPPQSANPVTFWVFAPFAVGDAAISSGFGSNTSVWTVGDQTPRRTPVGFTPA